MKKEQTSINELHLPTGSMFLGTTYLQKFDVYKDKNSGADMVRVWAHGETQMEQIIVKDIPVSTHMLRDLEDAPLHAVIDFENLHVKFYASGNGSFSEQKVTNTAEAVKVLKGASKPNGQPVKPNN